MPGRPRLDWRAAAAAAALFEIAWGVAALAVLYTPLYLVHGPPVEAILALTWSRVTFLGAPIDIGLTSHIHAGMLVAAVGSASAALLGATALYYVSRGAATPALTASTSAAIIALITIGPLEGAAEALKKIAEELASYTSFATNAGVIILGSPRLEPGAAEALVEKGAASRLSILAYLAAASTVLAHYLAGSAETSKTRPSQGAARRKGGDAAGGSGIALR